MSSLIGLGAVKTIYYVFIDLSKQATLRLAEPAMRTSIIINNYNYARFLVQAVDSALNQTYPDIEVVVVDEGNDPPRHIVDHSRFGQGHPIDIAGRVVPRFRACA